ncbi:retinoid-inducible serine carboxypeptidase, partial [Lasius niger]
MIWLQGGPGSSSTAYGNFEELGPLDTDLNPRNYTWVKDYNVLFIDNPVGTGFSYANAASGFVTTNAQIASDLLECIRGFYNQLPKFKSVPTYITTESYGGKMGAEFALVWYRAQKAGTIESNLKGVALGDAWISPIDSVMTWAPFLLSTGMVDTEGFKEIDTAAKITKNKVETDEWKTATNYWAYTQSVVLETTYNVDFYNILEKIKYSNYQLSPQSVLYYDGVELLLNETNLNVFVYNGQMDLIVDTPGTLLWVEKLKWKEADIWKNVSIREPLVVEDIVEGYYKAQANFAMYWVNRAGHM